MIKMFALLFLLPLSASVFAGPRPDSVMIPINRMFEGMAKGDSAMVRSAFVERPTLATVVRNKSGKNSLIEESLQQFLAAVGTPHSESWNEPIWEPVIQIDGILAQVWAPYAFYLGKKFSHCGVDTFQLIKGDDGNWRIFHLADTRKREGCNVPASVSDKFK